MRYPTLALALALSTAACEPEPRPAFSARVCLQLDHHGLTPTSATVYAQPAEDFPGYGPDMPARFSSVAEMGPTGRVCFEDFSVGPHWFAAEGFDASIRDSVRGSQFVEITTREDVYELAMPVSEQH